MSYARSNRVIFMTYFPQTYPFQCAATNRDWSQAPKRPDRCQLRLVQLGSDFSSSNLQRSLFHTPVMSDLKRKRPNDQKYATGITVHFEYDVPSLVFHSHTVQQGQISLGAVSRST